MNEKVMVADTLAGINGELTRMCRQLRQQGKKWIMSEACLARDKRG